MTEQSTKLLISLALAGLLVSPARAEGPDFSDMPEESGTTINILRGSGASSLVRDLTQADKGVMVRSSDTVSDGESEAVPQKKKDRKKSKVKGKEVEDTGISKENPMYITADRLRANDTTGDIDAMGRVVIKHMMDTYQTEYLYGNKIVQKYVIPGELRWNNPTTRLKAERADYDAAKGIGHFENLNGWDSGLYYYQGSDGVYDRNANKMVVQNGYFTTRHAVAKVPDYRIEAESIDIYPGDHFTAHNVKLMAKNTTLITLASYTGSLEHDNEISLWSLIPRPVFDSDNGFGLHNALRIPLGGDPDLELYIKNRWYTKAGYKPDMGIRYRTPIGTARFFYAEQESTTNDEGGLWIKKKPALSFDTRHFYLFGSRFYVGAYGEIGKWDEDQDWRRLKGTHKEFDIYVSGNPWKLGKFMNFGWRAGYRKDYYSFDDYRYRGRRYPLDDNIRRIGYYSLGLSGGYGPIQAWVSYTDRDTKGFTRYRYDSYSSEKPAYLGFRWQATHNDAFSLSWTIDTVDGRLDHRYWTYYRDMHSFYAWIRYDDIEKETKFMLMPKDFKF